MPDRIHIADLSVSCIIGTNPEERVQKQGVLINLALECDLRGAGQSDDIEDTVDYVSLKNRLVDMVEQSDFYLIERLAERIAGICLDTHGVDAATVRVDKPGALTFARSVAVEIRREASSV